MQTYEEAQMDRWYELQDLARELVEEGEIAQARRVFAEADAIYPETVLAVYEAEEAALSVHP